MASSWGLSWGTSWGNSWGDTGVIEPPGPDTGYVNETVSYHPRHERIGRPRPYLEPIPHHLIEIETGQGGQSVDAILEFKIKGLAQGSAGEADLYVEADVLVHQPQSARFENRMRMTGSTRSSQMRSGVVAKGSAELVAFVKSGGEPLIIPTYVGEETPDVFFETDRAA